MQLIDSEPGYQLYKANIPIKEGVYELAKLYAMLGNQTAVKQINKSYEVFDDPTIEFVKYDNAVKPGSHANIVFKARDTSGIKEAMLKLFEPDGNVRIISPTIANNSFVFSFPITKEPRYNFTAIFADPFGNKASYNGSITSLDNPRINSVEVVKYPDQGISSIIVNATDTSGIADALIIIDGSTKPMIRTGGLYRYDIFFGEEPGNKNILILVSDPYGMKNNISLSVNWLLSDAFNYFAYKNGFNQTITNSFYNNYQNIVSNLYDNRKLLLPMLNTYAKNQTLFSLFENNFSKDPQINTNRLVLLSKANELVNQLKLYNLNRESIAALGNLTIAYEQLALPKHSLQEIWLLTNVSTLNKDIVDFKPLIITDAANQKHVYASNNPARDYWIITSFLAKRPEYTDKPETFFWINNALQQLTWSIFDNKYGPAYYNDIPKPTDNKTWQIILSFMDYYGNSFPQFGNASKRIIVVPIYNKTKLIEWFGNKQDAKIGIWYLADLPAIWGNATHTYYGRDAMIMFVQAMPKEYSEILKLYREAVIDETPVYEYVKQNPDWYFKISRSDFRQMVKVLKGNPSDKYWEARYTWWQGWLGDRAEHGLNNTVNEFVKVEETIYKKYNPVFNNKTNYNWDLVRFIKGYERSKTNVWGGEWATYAKAYPLAFKAFGIPYTTHQMNFDSYLISQGAPGEEWGVLLPKNTLNTLLTSYSGKIAYGPGNSITLMSMINGLNKDTDNLQFIVTSIASRNPDMETAFYLWKKD
jgi:hypothetical protein